MEMNRVPTEVTLAIEIARLALGQTTEPRNLGRRWHHFDWELDADPGDDEWLVNLVVQLEGMSRPACVTVAGRTDATNPVLDCYITYGEGEDGVQNFNVLVTDGDVVLVPNKVPSDAELAQLDARQREVLNHERFGEFELAMPHLAAVLRERRLVQVGALWTGPDNLIEAAVTAFEEFLRR